MKEKIMGMQLPFLVLIFLCFSSTTWSTSLLHDQPQSSRHFVLVHGACLGAWSWFKVTTFLHSAGHNVTALDMAAAGIDARQAESLPSLTEYYEPLLSFMGALPSDEKIVLVGHSLGGLGISMAMEKFPEKISVAIFVAAFMPAPLSNFSSTEEQNKILGMYSGFYTEMNPQLLLFTKEQLATKLFPLSPPEDLTLATTLVRPQAMFGLVESMKELELTRDRYGSVKRGYIMSENDGMASKAEVLLMLISNIPDRVVEITGSDHMVMASKPLDLVQQLSTIAQDFPLQSNCQNSTC